MDVYSRVRSFKIMEFVQATGGTITYDGNYKIHTFTSGGTFTVTKAGLIEFLLVAGGAAGGHGGETESGGGGGAGGLIYLIGYNVTSTSYSIVIGAGSIDSGIDYLNPSKGGNSSFDSNVAIGGGAGISGYSPNYNNQVGGSGGGGNAYFQTIGGAGTYLQGNAGGNGVNGGLYPGGGGGGAGAVGQTPINNAQNGGNGGDGLQFSINGTPTYYAGGGGGGNLRTGIGGIGGLGGGGNGANSATAQSGTPNTGGGGGSTSANGIAGSGGSGIFICRYKYK